MSFKFTSHFSRCAAVALAAGLSCAAALADAKTYRIQADFNARDTADYWTYVEMFGNDISYVQLNNNFGGPQGPVASQLNSWLMPQVQGVGHADLQLSYDSQSPMTSLSSNGTTAYYRNAASPLAGTLSGAWGSQTLSSGPVTTNSYRSNSGHTQQFHITSTHDWFSGPLPENSFTLHGPTPSEFSVDLKAALGDAYNTASGALAGIWGLDSLQVRMTAPQTFAINSVDLYMYRFDPAGHFNNSLIDLLDAGQFGDHLVLVSFTGKFDVRVDRSDYATDAAFNAAKSWVDGNLRQIDYDMEANFVISSVTEVQAVPEPAVTWLMVGGLGVLAWRARRRARAN